MEELIKEEFIDRYLYLYNNREFYYKLLKENRGKYLQEGCRILEYILLGKKTVSNIYSDEDYFDELIQTFNKYVVSSRPQKEKEIKHIYSKGTKIAKCVLKKNFGNSKPIFPYVIKGKKFYPWIDRPTSKEIEDFKKVRYNVKNNNLYGENLITSGLDYKEEYEGEHMDYILMTLYEYIGAQSTPSKKENFITRLKASKLKCLLVYRSILTYLNGVPSFEEKKNNNTIGSSASRYLYGIINRIEGDYGECDKNNFIKSIENSSPLTEEEKKEICLRLNDKILNAKDERTGALVKKSPVYIE